MTFKASLVVLATFLVLPGEAFAPARIGRTAFVKDRFRPLHVATKIQDPKAAQDASADSVRFTETTHKLYFVNSLADIDKGKPDYETDVPAFQLENNVGVKVTAMAEGANMVQLSLDGVDYIWDNKEGAVFYGANSNAFPLRRGLILHGGVRFAAVTAEHGLYYDTDWAMSTQGTSDEKSILFTIKDSQVSRDRVAKGSPENPFSQGQFNRQDMNNPATDFLTKYPVTDLVFTYKITLRKDEKFVRLTMMVDNPTDKLANAEAWLPMTFPIAQDSFLLDEQHLRWRRDEWVFPYLANMFNWDNSTFYKPLDWPGSGIFYDFPHKVGKFHGVVTDPKAGRGIVYVAPEKTPHYTKMWSWGDKKYFNRQEALQQNPPLGAGRPYSEYYEPWSSGFNFAFFQTSEFKPKTSYAWEVALFPIDSGLTANNKKDLVATVKAKVDGTPELQTLSGVTKKPYSP